MLGRNNEDSVKYEPTATSSSDIIEDSDVVAAVAVGDNNVHNETEEGLHSDDEDDDCIVTPPKTIPSIFNRNSSSRQHSRLSPHGSYSSSSSTSSSGSGGSGGGGGGGGGSGGRKSKRHVQAKHETLVPTGVHAPPSGAVESARKYLWDDDDDDYQVPSRMFGMGPDGSPDEEGGLSNIPLRLGGISKGSSSSNSSPNSTDPIEGWRYNPAEENVAPYRGGNAAASSSSGSGRTGGAYINRQGGSGSGGGGGGDSDERWRGYGKSNKSNNTTSTRSHSTNNDNNNENNDDTTSKMNIIKKQQKHRVACNIPVMNVAVLVITIVLFLAGRFLDLSGDRQNQKSESFQNERFVEFRDAILYSGISLQSELDMEGTPQHRALHWIAEWDEMHLSSTPIEPQDAGVVELEPGHEHEHEHEHEDNEHPEIIPTSNNTTSNITTNTKDEVQPVILPSTTLERYALAVLYFSTNMAESRFGTGIGEEGKGKWLSGEDACGWTGVECTSSLGEMNASRQRRKRRKTLLKQQRRALNGEDDEEKEFEGTGNEEEPGRVTMLNVTRGGLTGSIPRELLAFRDMLKFDSSYNKIGGTLPDAIGDIVGLEEVWMFHNKFEGSIPSSIGNLKKLKHLNLNHNDFTGSIPMRFGNLTALEYLNVEHNHLNGTIHPDLGNLVKLKELFIYHNELSESVPPSVCELRKGSLRKITADCAGEQPKIQCDCCTHCE